MKINFLWPGLIFGLAFVQGVTGFPGGLLLVFLASLVWPGKRSGKLAFWMGVAADFCLGRALGGSSLVFLAVSFLFFLTRERWSSFPPGIILGLAFLAGGLADWFLFGRFNLFKEIGFAILAGGLYWLLIFPGQRKAGGLKIDLD